MQTFGRLLSVLTFLLSLGFLAQALPAAPASGLAVRQYNSPSTQSPGSGYTKPSSDSGSGVTPVQGVKTIDVVAIVNVDLTPKVQAHVAAIAEVKTVADLDVKVKALIVDIKAIIAILVGAKVNIDAEAKLKLAVAIHAMIISIVKVCATVVAKLGVSACVGIMAQLDVVIHSLILTLIVCIDGFLGLLVKLFVDVDATVVAAIKTCGLSLIAKILLNINLGVNASIN
ncbi:unnamed protein product [Rhizoctonia solani]|uniref:Transmembrane protein n=1 Tax=Rhizoctonia solani TaxID=456999 RepID=A0A8H3GIX1_9AGAM|nr:uncharacterized protein RhiXN_09606 [Rhizoctonia solani]QRW22019.1 hypothetical protein RhiXN_09606 [Rhizoctonia solani]CAE6451224.1 unnamed protein product [Rhizoctonia solani]